jgi:hypothetical protein
MHIACSLALLPFLVCLQLHLSTLEFQSKVQQVVPVKGKLLSLAQKKTYNRHPQELEGVESKNNLWWYVQV